VKSAGLLVLAALGAFPQTSSTVIVSNGVQLEISADMGHPTGQEQLTVSVARASGDSFYRIFRDQNNLMVYAYELEVNLSPSGDAVTVTAKPAEDEFAARYPNADAGKPVPSLSSDHVLGPLGSGQSATLNLFEIPGMGLQVSDSVRVKLDQNGESGAMRFAGLRVFENNKLISGPPPPSSVAGRFVMFYLPGRGGFFFSAEPVPGRPFADAGTVERNRMRFTVENENFECTSSSPILSGSSAGQVWVYHDPSYAPSGTWTQDPKTATPGEENFFTAASDSLGWWLP
jgi:hypothetical protein